MTELILTERDTDEEVPEATRDECDASAVSRVMGDILHRVEQSVASATCSPSRPLLPVDDDHFRLESKRHKKSRRHREEKSRKRKRSTSCSTVSSSCSSFSLKKHKKKKKKHRRDEDPPSPRVNPIFLWVKQDDTKIVEVLCEDYDKRNRITLTKTAAGWRAIPRTERLSRQSSYQLVNNGCRDTKDSEDDRDRSSSCEAEDGRSEPPETDKILDLDDEGLQSDTREEDSHAEEAHDISEEEIEEDCKLKEEEALCEECEDLGGEKSEDEEMPLEDIAHDNDEEDAMTSENDRHEYGHSEESLTESCLPRESSCEADKCCEMDIETRNVDENHNNEYEAADGTVQIENGLLNKLKECGENGDTVSQLYSEVEECVEKGLKDLIDELDDHCLHNAGDENNKDVCLEVEHDLDCNAKEAIKFMENGDINSGYLEHHDCDDLMEELEEICHGMINERLKTECEDKKEDEEIDDVYTFVPTPEHISTKEVIPEYQHVSKSASVTDSTEKVEIPPQVQEEEMREPQYEETNSPINLVVQHKETEEKVPEVQTIKLPDSLDSSLDILWRLPEGTTIHQASRPVNKRDEAKPAHQQNKTKYADILNIPQPRVTNGVQEEPLNLGKSKCEKNEVSIKQVNNNNFRVPTPKPAPEKVEDITIKNILSKQKMKPNLKRELSIDAKTKSKLLELLTSENMANMADKQDPLAQLKEVLSDPNLVVPDPLLVPRARLPALVANPAKEIPRLLSQKQEKMPYPKLDPDLLVVSLAHLQSLLQSNGKDEELTRLYQQQAQMLQSQLKQQDLDAASALNQMLWLPYLSQLEAAAAACGNNQDFVAMLNMMFPPYSYVQNPYMQQMVQQPYDINQSLQQNQMLSAWQEMMQKPHLTNYTNGGEAAKKYDPYKMYLKPEKKASARTSPLPNKYQQQKQRHGYSAPPSSNHEQSRQNFLSQKRHYEVPQTYCKTNGAAKQASSAHQRLADPFQRPYPPSRDSVHSGEVSKGPSDPSSRPRHRPETEFLLRPPESEKLSSEPSKPQVPKLKVKEHLVDPNARPNLLKLDQHLNTHPSPHLTDDPTHPHLWHPLFSSHQGKSYTSPWQWTTPVTVSGE